MHAGASIVSDFGMARTRSVPYRKVTPISLFSPEDEIFAQGERAGSIYRVEFGAVRVYRLNSDGRRQVVAFHLAGEMFGLEAGATHSFFADALVQTGLTQAGLPDEVSPELLMLALRSMIRAQEHLLVICRQSAVEKLVAFLMDMFERQGGLEQIDLPMSRIDIGEYLGMSIETVSRSFSKLRDEGLLRFHGARKVELLDIETLKRLCR
ncbi:transcriptional regulator [Rhizobium sp. Leaf384]|nr:transcriptional regulator [Rhizobium sp. Leaf384]KQS78419.1 transcriptional regulator [Rhizobium sp. Leaf383]